MGFIKQTFGSSIGSKAIVAVTGLGMVGFLVMHLSGNLLVFGGPEAIAAYAEGLRKFPMLLLGARIGLIVMTLLHISVAIKLNLASQAARPVKYTKKQFVKASLSSRTMVLTGLLILAYILFHLAHFTFRVTSAEIGALGPWEVHKMIVLAFSNPLVALTYIVAMVLLGMHLSHGLSSLWQTLGLNHKKYNRFLNLLGPVVGTLLAAGYISIPVAVLVGILK
jgi:succinate dehydrogenase / fumarate reductase cytochrome b subunit